MSRGGRPTAHVEPCDTPCDLDDLPVCPLCQRPILPDVPQNRHHLIPKLKGGAGGQVVLMHRMCHNEIHAVLSEVELARSYNTIEALRAHPHLDRFVRWLQNRPLSFHTRTRPGLRRRRR